MTSKVGTFSDAAIRFSYIEYPELHFNITVISTIEECIIEKAYYAIPFFSMTYYIGRDDISQGLPEIKAEPDCEMTIKSFDFDYAQYEDNLLELEIERNALIVKKTENLSLYGTRVEAHLTVYMNEYPHPLQLTIEVKYRSEGPEFVGQD